MSAVNILLSGATIKYAPLATAFPDETTVAYGASWGGSWVDLGETSIPLTLEYTENRFDADEQQYLAPVKDWRVVQVTGLRTALSQYTGDILALLLGGTNTDTAAGASQKAFSSVAFGGNPIVTQYAVGFEGYRPDTNNTLQPLRWLFPVASFMLDRGFSHSKREKTMFPIYVKTYADTSAAIGSQNGEVQIVTGPTT